MARKQALKKSTKAPTGPIASALKKPSVKEQLATLKATISEYFNHLKYRAPEYSIRLTASIAGENGAQKVRMVNVPSLIASVITAQGLNKEIRVHAVQDQTGGALEFLFYSPVNIDGKRDLLS
jgi:sensor domain CHASE-containing protein